MTLDDHELLRLHIEAGWGVRLPRFAGAHRVALLEGRRPPWSLYLARIGDDWIEVLPHGAAHDGRQARQLRATLARDPATAADASVHCEVVLRLTAAAPVPVAVPFEARRIARHELTLMESFDRGAASYYLLAPDRAPIYAAIEGGRVLAVAHSSRRIGAACELGIETMPEGRRRGYARALTRLWSAAVLAEGRVPLYSARATNSASLALAESAGYRVCARAAYLYG